jgi:hypothetical protein
MLAKSAADSIIPTSAEFAKNTISSHRSCLEKPLLKAIC